MKKILFFTSAVAMAIPFVLEFLLDIGTLKAHGSTIEDRQPLYAILMYTGLAGMIVIVVGGLLRFRKKS
jgi:hypothetical protein